MTASSLPLTVSQTLTEGLTLLEGTGASAAEVLTLTEGSNLQGALTLAGVENLPLFEAVQASSFLAQSLTGTRIRLDFPERFQLTQALDPSNYAIEPLDGGVPVLVKQIVPVLGTVDAGTAARVVPRAKVSGLGGVVTSLGTSTLTDYAGDFLGTGVSVGDVVEFETAVHGRTKYSVAAILSDTQITLTPSAVVSTSASYRVNDNPEKATYLLQRTEFVSNSSHVGDYLSVRNPNSGVSANNLDFLRIVEVLNATTVRVDRPLIVDGADLTWVHSTAVSAVSFTTSETTRTKSYRIRVTNLRTKTAGLPFNGITTFTADGERPKLLAVTYQEDGTILLDFDDDMRLDGALSDPSEYQISGPTTVSVHAILPVTRRRIALKTAGFGNGSYTLTVNASGTPKDGAGNPIDPTFNQAIFTASTPLLVRSIFTDKGPIAKPALTLQSGTGVVINTYSSPIFGPSVSFTSNEVTLTGGAVTSDQVGLYLRLTGSLRNDGLYKIAGLVGTSPTARVRLQASFSLPDGASAGSIAWELIDPRDGEIADDPSDVVVHVNGSVVAATAVIGLLGQVVLPTTPAPSDDVKIAYAWVPNPVVDFRRLNSQEFVLNNWSYDAGSRATPSQHKYRYRSTLVRPESFTPDDIQAKLPAPLLRDVHYRAYERAYSALLNDPALLRLNVPNHRIATAPLERTLEEVSVAYNANVLPESDPVSPWERKGSGPAFVTGGVLTVEDNTSGPFPGGDPLFWRHDVDLSFDHVFAATWRMTIPTVSAMEGVFTGVSVGWSTDTNVIVLGYLVDGGVKKLGLLKRGGGNDPSDASAWIGGLDSNGTGTNAPVEFDWSILHSYRFFRGKDGVVRLFVDGEITETLRVVDADLPFLNELTAPFDELQGVFFGSISRPAKTVSTWDFVRYTVIPTNPVQTAPSIFVSYEGGILPEVSTPPWVPVGYHGTEAIESGRLVLASTSATDDATEVDVGLVGGDFRGFTRIEPLLGASSDVVLDTTFKVLARTHGIDPNAIMVAVDDGRRLVQISILASTSVPKLSYPGRALPEESTPVSWTRSGTQTAEMVGRTLRLTDDSTTDGIRYTVSDGAAADSEDRLFGSLVDYTFEFRTKMNSYEADVTGFCGLDVDVHDGLRQVGVRFRRDSAGVITTGSGTASASTWVDTTKNFVTLGVVPGDEVTVLGNNYLILGVASTVLVLSRPIPTSGSYQIRHTTKKVAFHSGDQPLSPVEEYTFDWYDGLFHTIRVVKSSMAGTLVVDGFAGTFSYVNVSSGISALVDLSATFITDGVQVGDYVVVRSGPSTGTYPVTSVVSETSLEINGLPVISSGFVWEIQRSRNDTVSLFVDDVLEGTVDYGSFKSTVDVPTIGFGSYGIATGSLSQVDWMYVNAWRVEEPSRKYVGLWKGTNTHALTDYYLPLKTQGAGDVTTTLGGTTFIVDTDVNFVSAGVVVGDAFLIDEGPNAGSYTVQMLTSNEVGVRPALPVAPTTVNYRIPATTNWSVDHKYRIVRDPAGSVALFLDADSTPAIRIAYNETSLPSSTVGVPSKIQGRFPSITWGAFDPTNLSRTDWDFLRYGVARSASESRILPPHQVLNQRNVMSSPEHLKGSVVHNHTQFSSSSTGVPYPWEAYVENTAVQAFTRLNEGTPIVPQTQTYEVRRPTPVFTPVASLNSPGDVLNSDGGFLLNNATLRVQLIVPKDVLYNSLEIVEKTDGELDLLTPFTDAGMQSMGPVNYTKDVCLHYEGDVLPENDTASPTPWALASDPSAVYAVSSLSSFLSYSVHGGQTVYRNDTPLTDPVSLDTDVSFRLQIVTDATTGTGDSGVRVGFSAFGLTAALAFVTTPLGDREVRLLDLHANEVLGSIFFDYLDGQYHTYRLRKNVDEGSIEFSIDGYGP